MLTMSSSTMAFYLALEQECALNREYKKLCSMIVLIQSHYYQTGNS